MLKVKVDMKCEKENKYVNNNVIWILEHRDENEHIKNGFIRKIWQTKILNIEINEHVNPVVLIIK